MRRDYCRLTLIIASLTFECEDIKNTQLHMFQILSIVFLE
jgi:hypothetical protein